MERRRHGGAVALGLTRKVGCGVLHVVDVLKTIRKLHRGVAESKPHGADADVAAVARPGGRGRDEDDCADAIGWDVPRHRSRAPTAVSTMVPALDTTVERS